MITVEQNQEDTDLGREQEKSVLRKDVRVKTATAIAHTNSILIIHIIPIKRSEVNIGRSFIDIDVTMGCSENAVNDEGSERKHEGGKSTRVRNKLNEGWDLSCWKEMADVLLLALEA